MKECYFLTMPAGFEESGLVKAAADGDGQAFARLYDAYEKRIFNYCLRLLGGKADAEDATQEAFLKVFARLPEMTGQDVNFGAYMFTAARNASYDVISRRKKNSPVDELPADAAPMFRETAELDTDPERANLLESQRGSVQAANAMLPERQREVLALREVEEMSYDEIAEVMDSNPNSVAQLISRARLGLRNNMLVGAGAAIGADTPECERAMPLLAMKQDGKLKAAGDVDWIEGHLATCQSCQLSEDAMAEAGVSYRAWLPVAPAAYLFRDTLAKASESIGADWSGIERPSGPSGSIAASGAGESTGASADEAVWRRRNLMAGAAIGLALLIALVTAISVDDSASPEGFGVVDTSAKSETVEVFKKKNRPSKAKGDGKRRAGSGETVVIVDESVSTDSVTVPDSGGSGGTGSAGGGSPNLGRPAGGGSSDPSGGAIDPPSKPDPIDPVVPPVTPEPEPEPEPVPPTPIPPVPGGPIPG